MIGFREVIDDPNLVGVEADERVEERIERAGPRGPELVYAEVISWVFMAESTTILTLVLSEASFITALWAQK